MEPTHSKTNLNVPMAIVVAGLLIAGAIFFRGSVDSLPHATAEQPVVKSPDLAAITLRAVDETDHIRGNPNADIVFVEFSDTECPFCKRFHFTMQEIINQYGKSGSVAWVYRQFPIVQLHAKAPKEAEALECAAELGGNEKFWEYTDRLFATTNSNDSLDPAQLPRIAVNVGLSETEFMNCYTSGQQLSRVQADMADGATAGVNGTPHSILVLKKPITVSDKKDVLAVMEPFRDPVGDLPIKFSLDGLRFSLNGALPLDAVKKTVDILLK